MGFIFRSVRAAGGWLNALRQTIRLNEVRIGSEVGRDEFGNVYYESKEYFYDDWRMALDQNLLVVVIMFNLSRDRWIDYNRRDYDASQVPPEWHHWLHHTTDIPPSTTTYRERKFHSSHCENLSGTAKEYVPYSTTKEKVTPWKANGSEV
jgi:NADH:ubiquinone oxidoreductase subunit